MVGVGEIEESSGKVGKAKNAFSGLAGVEEE